MYRLNGLIVNPQSREIVSGDRTVPVEPLVFDLILSLLRNRHRVVTKDELVDRLWDGRVISDSTLASCVKAARRALGDDGRRQEIIRTMHRRGFRCVADVEERVPATAAGEADPTYGIDLSLPQRPSVAVLPFEIVGSDAHAAAIARGLVRDITLGLARTRWLFVTAEASARRFTLDAFDPQTVGKALGVRYLLSGTFRKQDARLRISVTMIDAVNGNEIWAERFDRGLDGIFELQDEIASIAVAAADAQIARQERGRAMRSPIEMLDAWGAYHAALDLLHRFNRDNGEQAAQLLDRAAALEPASGHICAAKSYLCWLRAFLEISADRADDLARATDFAREAVSLDPLDAQAHWALGRAELISGAQDLAMDRFTTAIDLNPCFAQGHYNRGWARLLRGDIPDGIADLDEARRLSPHDPLSFAFMGLKSALLSRGDDPHAAVDWARRSVRQPHCHYHNLAAQALILWQAGHDEEARDLARQISRQRPGYTAADFMATAMVPQHEAGSVADGFHAIGLSRKA